MFGFYAIRAFPSLAHFGSHFARRSSYNYYYIFIKHCSLTTKHNWGRWAVMSPEVAESPYGRPPTNCRWGRLKPILSTSQTKCLDQQATIHRINYLWWFTPVFCRTCWEHCALSKRPCDLWVVTNGECTSMLSTSYNCNCSSSSIWHRSETYVKQLWWDSHWLCSVRGWKPTGG